MSATHYLAIDLGAESGRIMQGTLEEGQLTLREIHRFANRTVTWDGHLFWDLAALEKEIFLGLEKVPAETRVAGVSADSWGVDYVLLDAAGAPLGPAYCYRDPRTAGSEERLARKIARTEIYAETGIQFMAINTLFQLEAETREPSPAFRQADHFLTIADYVNARLSGVTAVEESLASTTQLYRPQDRAWSQKLIRALGLAPSFFPRLVPSGTLLGPATGSLASTLPGTQVIATCSHDTGAAIAAVPAHGEDWAYLSSGTWSLLGAELPAPCLTEEARLAGFTNEAGLGGSIRFLKNIVGLWIIQECRRAWAEAGEPFSYEELTQLAEAKGPAAARLSLHDERFLTPGAMPEKIAAFCRETGQPEPKSPGQYVRLVLESLAYFYAETLRELERLTGRKFRTLHIVGGGSRNDLLNQLTANATGLTVVTGPVEATAIGNILIQALALGQLTSSAQLRELVAASFPTRTFFPGKN